MHLGIDIFHSLLANISHWRNDYNSIYFLAKQKQSVLLYLRLEKNPQIDHILLYFATETRAKWLSIT